MFLLITLQNEGSASCPPGKTDNTENGRILTRVKLRVVEVVLQSIHQESELQGALTYAKSICTKIDEMVHKCIVLMFRMGTVDKLEAFWNLYQTGGLLTLLSNDILTPQRRRQMITDAKNEGIELKESDFCLQITIKESDYLYVKDVLTSKNGRFEIEWDIYKLNIYITKILFHSTAHFIQVDLGFEHGSGHTKVIKLVFVAFLLSIKH